MDVNSLYLNKDFDDYILGQCWRKNLNYDDSKQDIFVEIISSGASTTKRAKQIANAYFQRVFYNRDRGITYSSSEIQDIEDDRDYSSLWEDTHII